MNRIIVTLVLFAIISFIVWATVGISNWFHDTGLPTRDQVESALVYVLLLMYLDDIAGEAKS